MDGVEAVALSGLRATVSTKDGSSLTESDTKSALKAKGVKLVSFESKQAVVAKATYTASIAGGG